MPQLTGNFGPIPQQVTLDGSGNGTVSFQVNGGTARFTNIFIKVSSSNAQAMARIYRGTISDTNLINQTNSGSTGAAATGVIDVTDGVTLFIVWTGGDPGATAIATFTGYTIPFAEARTGTQLVWDNPLAANDGTLIFPAIKSDNFVAGVSGWYLGRDGTIEAVNGIFSGELDVIGANGAFIKAYVNGANDPEIDFQPENIGGHSINPGQFYSLSSPGATNRVFTRLTSPSIDGASPSEIALYTSDGLTTSEVDINADVIQIGGELLDATTLADYHPCIANTFTQVVTAPGSSFNRVINFPAGVSVNPTNYVVNVMIKSPSASGDFAQWSFRTSAETNTSFTLTGARTAGVGATITLVIGYTVTFF